MYDLAILGGNVVSSGSVAVADILIQDGVVAQVLPADEGCGAGRGGVRAEREVDARGMLVMPGVIDPHVHFELRSAARSRQTTLRRALGVRPRAA